MFQQSFLRSLRTQEPQADVPAQQPQIISNVFIDFSLHPLYYGNMFWQVKKSLGEKQEDNLRGCSLQYDFESRRKIERK